VSISDPFACTDNGDTLNVQVVANNPGAALVGATVQSTLPAGLAGLAGTCTSGGGSGSPICVVDPGGMTWTGDIPAGGTLTIDYQVRVAAGVPLGTPLCISTVFDNGVGGGATITECATVDCPPSPTSVDLRYFRAIGLAERVILAWETASEVDTLGFDVLRAPATEGPWTLVNTALIPAEGEAAAGRAYLLRDAPGPGTWHYRLEDVGADGKRSPHPATEVRVGPDAEGHELFVPSAQAARAGRPAAMTAQPRAPEVTPDPLPEGWLARLWRWIDPAD